MGSRTRHGGDTSVDAAVVHGCVATQFDLEARAWLPGVGAVRDGRDDVVDLWRLRHDLLTVERDVVDLLSAAERARAAGYRRTDDRRRFTVARAGLRVVLARYGDTTPAAVDLVQRCPRCGGAHGRITVHGPGRLAGARVSVSHAPDWTVYAVAAGHTVGVDIEPDNADVADVAALVTTAAERAALRDLPRAARHAEVLELWTRKEAVLKARGTGMLDAPDRVDVLGRRSGARGAPDASDAPAGHHLHRLVVERAHRGALAVAGPNCTVRLWTLDPRA